MNNKSTIRNSPIEFQNKINKVNIPTTYRRGRKNKQRAKKEKAKNILLMALTSSLNNIKVTAKSAHHLNSQKDLGLQHYLQISTE